MFAVRPLAWSALGLALVGSFALAACSGGSTTTSPTDTDAGLDGSAGEGDGGEDANSTASVCTSGKTWTRGTIGSSIMRPGDTCISCHKMSTDAPTFLVAGTAYPTRHEPLLCNGLSGVKVIITDAKGVETTLTTNTVGNFACGPVARSGFPACNPTFPISARIVAPNGNMQAMIDPQMTGDCNSCHTETGLNNAPGRISAP